MHLTQLDVNVWILIYTMVAEMFILAIAGCLDEQDDEDDWPEEFRLTDGD